jgi:hypothetical protein
MNLRWLWFDYVPREIQLDASQRTDLAHTMRWHHHWNWTQSLAFALVLAAIIAVNIWAMGPIVRLIPALSSSVVSIILRILSAVVAWVTVAWIRRSNAEPATAQALRELGFDMCIECGYWLRDLRADQSSCPECGATRSNRFHMDTPELHR